MANENRDYLGNINVPVFTLDYLDFKKEQFSDEIFEILVDLFSTGVRVNGTLYTLGESVIPMVNVGSHTPSDYNDGTAMYTVSLLSRPVSHMFTIMDQMAVVERLAVSFLSPVDIDEALFVTTSPVKRDVYVDAIEKTFGVVCDVVPGVSTEIQGSLEDIVFRKADEVYPRRNQVVIVDDTSLGFRAMGYNPGPYIKDFRRSMSAEDIFKMLTVMGDRTCDFTVAVCASYSRGRKVYKEVTMIRSTYEWRGKSEQYSFGVNIYNIDGSLDSHYSLLIRLAIKWLKVRLRNLERSKKKKKT